MYISITMNSCFKVAFEGEYTIIPYDEIVWRQVSFSSQVSGGLLAVGCGGE